MLIMKSWKWYMAEGTALTNHEKITTVGGKKIQILGNIESCHHQTSSDERKNKNQVS